MNRTAPPRLLAWLGAGFVVWSSALVALYAVHAIGCAFFWRAGLLRLGLGAVILMHMTALAVMWHRLATRPDGVTDAGTRDFLVTLSLWATIAAAATTVLSLGPTLLLTTCV